MNTRTDLAIESINNIKSSSDIIKEERFVDDIKITKITINDEIQPNNSANKRAVTSQ